MTRQNNKIQLHAQDTLVHLLNFNLPGNKMTYICFAGLK